MVLQYRRNRSSNFLVFHTPSGISSRPAVFLFIIFVSATSSSCVNCPSLIINNFRDRFICNFSVLSKKILEMFFPLLYSFFLAGSF